jgi:hypothetical protein
VTPDDLVAALQPLISRVRTDVTAVRIADGTSRWTTEALTDERMRAHVKGIRGRGVCPIREGASTTRLALYDLDSHKGEVPWSDMQATALGLMAAMRAAGLQPVAFRSSGGRGMHVFALWDEPQDAYSVRVLMGEVLASVGMSPGAGGVGQAQAEIFPKQDRIAKGERGNQFILPLTGKSEPLDELFGLEPAGREAVLHMDWPMSADVPVRTPPVREAAATEVPTDIERVRSALRGIPNPDAGEPGEIDYDTYRNLAFAVHEATGGSEDGRELFCEWSAQSNKHDGPFVEKRVWPYIRSAGARSGSPITRATLFAHATSCGWRDVPTADGFDEEPVREMPARSGGVAGTALAVREAGGTPWKADGGAAATGRADDLFGDDSLDLFEGCDLSGAVDGSGALSSFGQNLERLALEDVEPPDTETLPSFERDPKSGKIKPIITNLLLALRRPDIVGCQIRMDRFREEIMLASVGGSDWRALGDDDYVWIRNRLESGRNGFGPISKELVRDVVGAVAAENAFDSAIEWLTSLPDDGGSRCETFLIRHFGAEDTPYVRAVSLYLWTALAGRVMDPGCKADMAPILVGAQGLRKSTAIAALVPSPDFFFECSFTEKEDDIARKIRGKLVAEIAELRGLHTKDLEGIKAFIARTHEEWVPKFKEFSTKFPRRLVFVGTTNKDTFLADETGNRRWLPLRVTVRADVGLVRSEAPLLWAEALRLWRDTGVQWQTAERLAEDVHQEFSFIDPWEEKIRSWLLSDDLFDDEDAAQSRQYVTTGQVLIEAMGYEARSVTRRDEMRAAAILKQLGYVKRKMHIHGARRWVFVPTVPTLLHVA